MINEKELRISNKSYINRDFATIYPQLIEFIENETNRWSPSTSNESDPGVVLVKLMAFVTDILGYNVDKNVLENFLLSATQESSVRKLCDILGYQMKYYVAPTTNLTLTYVGELSSAIEFPALSTVFTSKDEDSEVSFISTQIVTLSKQNEAQTCPVIQGRLKELRVNTSGDVTTDENKSLVQLINLDDNNRVYFPEVNVAENGVFITNNTSSSDFWSVKKSLNDVAPSTPCFKFGFDSSRELPYIEFPKDIASLIGNGLYVRYVLTDGQNGNVSANVINALDSTTSESWNALVSSDDSASDNLYVRNFSATVNGANPESIDSAYNNYKKVVGTFNTLTTCRDYANAIYSLTEDNGVDAFVSNVQVSDRRDDINYAKRIKSYDALGEVVVNNTDASKLNAFQLCCYPLAPISSMGDIRQYEHSFTPLTNAGRSLTSQIENAIETYKTISHDYKTLEQNDIYAFKNKLALEGGLVTNYKVNAYEAVEIDNNVINQLITDYNARKVDYGYEIPYDSLVTSIMNADKRINYVSLMEPELETYVLLRNGDEIPLVSEQGSTYYVKLLAKNILAGKIALFEYDRRFNFDLGQQKITGKNMVNEKVKSITTNLSLTLTSGQEETIHKNEAIQFIAPNVITELTYPAYCYFRFVSASHGVNNPITANTVYELQPGEYLYMGYTENDIWKVVKYVAGDIIKPVGFNLFNTPNSNDYSTYDRTTFHKSNPIDLDQDWFFSLTAQESIEKQKVNRVELTKKTKCYWIRNNASNKLFTDDEWTSGTGKAILKENEYFFYTDAAETQLVSLGSGTTIESSLSSLQYIEADVVELSDVVENGMLALKDKWKVLNFSAITPMKIQENNILTLSENDTLTMRTEDSSDTFTITGTLTPIPTGATFEYSINGASSEQLEPINITNGNWQARSRLHLNVTSDEPQIINDGIDGATNRQSVSFTLDGVQNPVVLDTAGQHFNLNTEMHNEGGTIDTTVNVKTVSGVTPTYPVSMYCYDVEIVDDEEHLPHRDLNGYATYEIEDEGDVISFELPEVINNAQKENAVLMLYFNKTSGSGTLSISVDGDIYEIQKFNPESDDYDDVEFEEGICILDLHRTESGTTSSNLTISNSEGSTLKGYLTVGTLDFYSGLNKELSIDEFVEAVGSSVTVAGMKDALMDEIREDDFYYNCKIENASAIESKSMMSPYTFYDANNVANKFTLSQIDFSNSKIDVVKSSRQ